MKFLYKGLLVTSLALCMTSMTAFATETSEVPSEGENISFDYQTNMFDINAGTGAAAEQELTVMLVKGDYTTQNVGLSQIDASNVYYVGQKNGTNYDIFKELGVKYDSGAFTPGVYTLITSGESTSVTRTKLVIGNALNKDSVGNYLPADMKSGEYEFGSVSESVRYYPQDADGKYIYVCYASFPPMNSFESAGVLFQNISGSKIGYLVKSLKDDFNSNITGINSISAGIDIGIQVNNVPDSVENIVAIPYVKN